MWGNFRQVMRSLVCGALARIIGSGARMLLRTVDPITLHAIESIVFHGSRGPVGKIRVKNAHSDQRPVRKPCAR